MHDYDKKVIIRKAEKILQECNQKYEKKKLKSTENCKLVAKLNKQNKRLKRINKIIITFNICMCIIFLFIYVFWNAIIDKKSSMGMTESGISEAVGISEQEIRKILNKK